MKLTQRHRKLLARSKCPFDKIVFGLSIFLLLLTLGLLVQVVIHGKFSIDQKSFKWLTGFIISFICFFGVVAFIHLWEHSHNVLQNLRDEYLHKKELYSLPMEKLQNISFPDYGMVFFAGALLVWQFQQFWGLTGGILNDSGGWIVSWFDQRLIGFFLSPLNSMLILLYAETIVFNQPTIYSKIQINLKAFNLSLNFKKLIYLSGFLVIVLTGISCMLFPDLLLPQDELKELLNTKAKIAESYFWGKFHAIVLWDFLYSVFATGLLLQILWKVLKERFSHKKKKDQGYFLGIIPPISKMQSLLVFTFLITMFSQLDRLLHEDVFQAIGIDGTNRLLIFSISRVTFTFSLFLLFFPIAYSWVDYLRKLDLEFKYDDLRKGRLSLRAKNKELEKSREDLEIINNELAKESNHNKALRTQMNHTIKGSLRNLYKDLVKMKSGKDASDEQSEALLREIIHRISGINILHEKLHETGQESINLIFYFQSMIKALNQSHAPDHVECKLDLPEGLFLKPKTLLDIGTLITEAYLNAYKAYQKKGIERGSRNFYISCVSIPEGKDLILALQLSDKAGGGLPDSISKKGFGLLLMESIISEYEEEQPTFLSNKEGSIIKCKLRLPSDAITYRGSRNSIVLFYAHPKQTNPVA